MTDLLTKLKTNLNIDDQYYAELYSEVFQHSMDQLNTTEAEDVDDALAIADAQLYLRNTQADLQQFFMANNLSSYVMGRLLEDGISPEDISKCLDQYSDPTYVKFLQLYHSAAYEYSQLIVDMIEAGISKTKELIDSGNDKLN